ncbi:MAG: hypothetical protein QXP41_00540 [Candidatus Nitrosocaldus sp.]
MNNSHGQNEISKDGLIRLVAEAKQVTAYFAAWSGGLADDSMLCAVPIYFQWVEIAEQAIHMMAHDADHDARNKLAERLINVLIVPINGMIQAIHMYGKNNNIALPPIDNVPQEIHAYKDWGIDYITRSLVVLKEANKS